MSAIEKATTKYVIALSGVAVLCLSTFIWMQASSHQHQIEMKKLELECEKYKKEVGDEESLRTGT